MSPRDDPFRVVKASNLGLPLQLSCSFLALSLRDQDTHHHRMRADLHVSMLVCYLQLCSATILRFDTLLFNGPLSVGTVHSECAASLLRTRSDTMRVQSGEV